MAGLEGPDFGYAGLPEDGLGLGETSADLVRVVGVRADDQLQAQADGQGEGFPAQVGALPAPVRRRSSATSRPVWARRPPRTWTSNPSDTSDRPSGGTRIPWAGARARAGSG